MKKITFKFIIVAFLLLVGNVNSFAQLFLNASPNQGCAPLTVTYNLTGSYAGEYRCEWNFQDGSPIFRDTVPFSNTITHQFFNAGYYNAVINVFDASNNPISPSNCNNCNVQVNGFSISSSDSACVNDIISFNVNGQGQPNSAIWNFGDGSPISNDFNPSHAYTSVGTKTVTLLTSGGQCGNQTTTKNIYVSTVAYPHPNAWTNSNVSCTAVPINFSTNTYSTYSWNFGDGGTSNVQNPQHLYTTNGTKNVSLTVTNGCGKSGTTTMTVVISNNPAFPNYQDFKLKNQSLSCPNSNVGFNAPHGYNNYEWNFGDGSPLLTTTNNFSNHTYGNTLTTYTASVKITSPCGNDTTLTSSLLISSTAPWPNQMFSLYVNSPSCPNSYVGLNAPGGYSNYQWNFGDNSPVVTTNNNQNNHFYGSALSTYNVSVKITSACGNDTTLYSTLAITNSAPFPNQSWFKLETGSNSACPNDQVGFNAPDGYSNYEWNFGDGTVSNTNDNFNTHKFGNSSPSYTISVKITDGCGNDTTLSTNILINSNAGFPTGTNFNLNVNSPACPNSNVGIEAPDGYSNYIWNFGDGSPLITSNNRYYNHIYGSALQSYTVSVKITNGCGHDTTLYTILEIKNNVGFSNDSWFKVEAGPNPSCPNDQVNFNAPWGYSNYFWKFGDGDSISSSQGNAHHAYSSAATYTYYVKITNACGKDTTLYGTIVVGTTGSFYSGLSINTDPSTSSCPNDLIHFKLNQNGFQSYAWDFGDGTMLTTAGEDIQHAFTTVGTKTVSCKVKNGCGDSTTIYATVQVLNNSPVSDYLEVSGIQNPSCPGDKVFFIINHGQGTTEYIWNYGDGSPADTTIGAGSHHIYTTAGAKTVTVIAKNACGMTKTITMVQNVSTTIFPSLIGDDGKKTFGFPGGDGNNTTAGCAGDAIVFYFMGDAANNVWNFGDGNTGTATEHVLIDGGDGVFPVTIIKHVFANNGPYTVSLTLTNNCGNSVTDSISLNIGGNQVVNGELVTSPPPFTTCAPISFLAFGGANYAWNFGDGATLSSSSPTASHTFAADSVYVVTVVITNGCGNSATYSKSVNVNGAGGPAVTLTSSTSPTCGGGNNGSATISVSNGQEPYTYLWNDPNAQDSSTVTNLAAGIYYATVTDNIGCASTFAVSISNPSPIVVAANSSPSTCGSSTGSATIAITSGGTSPFTYLWTNGGTNSSATGLHFGLYSVTVADLNGCNSTSNVSISESNSATITLGTVTNPTCHGDSNGALNITIAGGTAPYTYLWSNGVTTQNLSNIAAGDYSLVVTDNGGCNAAFNNTIGETENLSVITSTVTSPTCGNHDGAASATVSGGTSPYSYLWDSGTNSTSAVVSGLFVGTYTCTVTDAHGCTTAAEISLSNSNAPLITELVTDVTCFGLSDGAIDVTITGGTSPYLKTWSVGAPQTNNEDLINLTNGNYVLFVNDAQGCTSVRIYTVTQPALLTATVNSTGATCNHSDGSASVVPLGGNTSYNYVWSGGGQTTATAANLAVGAYTVTVTDNKGCITSASTNIAQITPKPSICMVTVDELSTNNIVFWDKTPFTSVDSFIVYREVSTSIYKRIGAVPFDSLSEFVDTSRNVGPANGDPNVGAYRYKLQIRDLCGDYSALSLYHNTIYIAGPDNNGNFDWNLPYAIEGSDPNISNYRLLCDTSNNTIPWFEVGAVAGTQANVADADYLTHKNNPLAQWRVKTDWTTICEPTRAAISTTRSNIKRPGISIGISAVTKPEIGISIFPNPAKDNVTIELSYLTENAQLKIINVLGQTVFNENIIASSGKKVKQINTTNFAKGIYTVVLETKNTKTLKKLVVN
jgi:PKD repeat protein